jgi:hypothetical protein
VLLAEGRKWRPLTAVLYDGDGGLHWSIVV